MDSPENNELATSSKAEAEVTPIKPVQTSVKQRLLSTPSIIIILVSVLLSVLLSSYMLFQNELKKTSPSDKQVEQPAIHAEKLIAATDATFPPMESLSEQGAIIGYDIDLGKNIAMELGTTIEFQNVAWENIFKTLEKNKVNMIISSVTINDERKKLYNFSNPYLNAGQVIITRKENNSIKETANLAGMRVGVQNETVSEPEALKYTAEKLVIRYKDTLAAAEALLKGKIDAIITDLPGAKGIVTKYPTLKIASDPFTVENYGIVLQKTDSTLLMHVNEALETLRRKGILEDLKQKWLE